MCSSNPPVHRVGTLGPHAMNVNPMEPAEKGSHNAILGIGPVWVCAPIAKRAETDSQEEVVILSYDSYMLFQLNFKSGKAVYLQLVDQVRLAAAAGRLQAGESLPAIRPLAEELRGNRNTVAKAYAELESQGVIE